MAALYMAQFLRSIPEGPLSGLHGIVPWYSIIPWGGKANCIESKKLPW